MRAAELPLTGCVALCRLFVLGIGFFSLCFLMTSLGGQFSARRPGDSPFTVRTEGILVGSGVRKGCRCLWVEEREVLSQTLSEGNWLCCRWMCEHRGAWAWAW